MPIVQLGSDKHRVFGNAPLIYDLARTEEDRQLMRFLYGPTEISRAFAAPPGAPAEPVAILRKAFWEMANSPELKADAQKQGLILKPMNWQETEAAFRATLNVPKSVIESSKVVIRD